jgi:hypothetical protein
MMMMIIIIIITIIILMTKRPVTKLSMLQFDINLTSAVVIHKFVHKI